MIINKTPENGFMPFPPSFPSDLIYLCSPNNPTGVAIDRKTLCLWVDYALAHNAIIIFDGAYESFITTDECPHSIYEIEGAKEVAIEIRSFSKTAGFAGLRCSYMVIPKELRASLGGKEVSLHRLYRRLCETKSGGVSYPIQKCAAAVYTPEGQKEVNGILDNYKNCARFLLEGLQKLGWTVFGGVNSPYIWCKTQNNLSSWDFFNLLLEEAHVISIPGTGFGRRGEGFIRLSAFADSSSLAESLLRLKRV